MPFRLLRCLAKALAKNGVKFVCGFVPGGITLYEIATEAWEDYRRHANEDALRQEVQDLAQAPAERLNAEVRKAVGAVASGLSTNEQQALATYLGQVPASIRRSLRRPADPTGTTVPATLRLNRPEGLVQLLPPRPPRFQPGDRPPGVPDFVLEELIGIGGFGEVWKARNVNRPSQPPVALKFCLDDAKDAVFLKNEVEKVDRVLRRGRHPGIVPLLHTFLSATPPCLAYEYVAGGDLTGLIRELHEQKRLTPQLAARFLLHLAEIVSHVHDPKDPIVHSDLKPANVLVTKLASGYQLRVTDFGIGRLAAAQAVRGTRQPTFSREQMVTEAVRGAYTPLYAPPQQMTRVRGEKADTRDDVYALGVIWYQLVTGDLAMTSIPTEWRERLEERGMRSKQVELLGACMAASEERRPANAQVLAKRLRALLRPAKPARRPARKVGPWLLAAVGLAVLAVVVLGAWWLNWLTSVNTTIRNGRNEENSDRGSLLSKETTKGPEKASDRTKETTKGQDKVPDRTNTRHPLLDCSSDNGVSPEEVRQAQEACAKALGRKVEEEVEIANGVTMKFVLIPPGRFRMGSPNEEAERSDDERLHTVTLKNPFYIGKYPVTQAQYEALTGLTPSYFKGDDQLPVEQVSWEDCDAFGKKWSARRQDGWIYRLPTEAEWEYSCRGGRPSSKPFGIGDGTSLDSTQANFDGTSPYGGTAIGVYREKTTPVGSFKASANAFGLFDMHGNVWQWCSDWKGDYPAEADDPAGPPQGSVRVLRGGSWNNDGGGCRAARRYSYVPSYRLINTGFRLARVPSGL